MQAYIIVIKFIEYMTFLKQNLNTDFFLNYILNTLLFHPIEVYQILT